MAKKMQTTSLKQTDTNRHIFCIASEWKERICWCSLCNKKLRCFSTKTKVFIRDFSMYSDCVHYNLQVFLYRLKAQFWYLILNQVSAWTWIMDDGCIVRVIKDFLTINEGELCVTKGEFLQVKIFHFRKVELCSKNYELGQMFKMQRSSHNRWSSV